MKKYLCLVLALLLLLSACGKSAPSEPAQAAEAPAADDAPANPEPEPEGQTASELVQNEEKEPVHPYEWLGLSGMPECKYLDTICTNHYYQVYDSYTSEGKQEVVDAADGVDALLVQNGIRSLTVGGMVYIIDDEAKVYTLEDITDLAAQAKSSLDYALENGVNSTGRAFQDTGRSAVPLYGEDTAEYEYYEFQTSNPGASELTERFFLRDGDVFAIYSLKKEGDHTEETTKVIKSYTADIPAGTLAVPDLSGYSRAE